MSYFDSMYMQNKTTYPKHSSYVASQYTRCIFYIPYILIMKGG